MTELDSAMDDYSDAVETETGQCRVECEFSDVEKREQEFGRGFEGVDDYIRNFLVRNRMHETLLHFEQEWRCRRQKDHDAEPIHEIYRQNKILEEKRDELENELRATQRLASTIEGEAERLRKERDAHRLQHNRISQEKKILVEKLEKTRDRCAHLEQCLAEEHRKHKQQLREAAIVALRRDKLQRQLVSAEDVDRTPKQDSRSHNNNATTIQKSAPVSVAELVSEGIEPVSCEETVLKPLSLSSLDACDTLSGHTASVSDLAMHPTKPIVVSASGDCTWKMWSLAESRLIMTGEGHSDSVNGVDFNTLGSGIATGSADGTAKVWDFRKQKCVKTLRENQPILSVKHQSTTNSLATGSTDGAARLWELATGKCISVFRRHNGPINEVTWTPDGSILCTASSDKCLFLWDPREGQCLASLHGHSNTVNCCCFKSDGHTLASCDDDGCTKIWDTRNLKQRISISASSPSDSATNCVIDRSGKVVVVAYSDGCLKSHDLESGKWLDCRFAHRANALCVLCDLSNEGLVSSGADLNVKYWHVGPESM